MKPQPSYRHIVKLLLLTALLLLALTSLYPRTYHIKQDGTGDFTTINAAINIAVTGDILLVYPGWYIENISYHGKRITITSLYGVTSDEKRIIRETIIDGNNNDSVVSFTENETRESLLNGFTIQHGNANRGGGIFIINSSPTISNCIIKNNQAIRSGGGMELYFSNAVVRNCIIEHNTADGNGGISHFDGNAFFAGNTIRYNKALNANGGFLAWGAVLCNTSLNSIYLNNAGRAVNDLSLSNMTTHRVIVDTFTVIDPDLPFQQFIAWVEALDDDTYSFTALNSMIETVTADLYVAANGSNSNSGLNREEPLQTIAYAMSKIKAEGPERKNIFVANGVYSASLNNQVFPVQVLSNINIIGESKENTILDLEHRSWAFSAIVPDMRAMSGPEQRFKSNFSIKNFTMTNGKSAESTMTPTGIDLGSVQDYEIENIDFINARSKWRDTGSIYSALNANFLWRNINLIDNQEGQGLNMIVGGGGVSDTLKFHLENVRINRHSHTPIGHPDLGSGMSMGTYILRNVLKPVHGTFVNLEITDSKVGNIDPFWGEYPYSHFNYFTHRDGYEKKLYIINSTIGNNQAVNRRHGGGMFFSGCVEAYIINSIIYGNRPDNLTIYNQLNHQMDIHFIHSILEGGVDNVKYYDNANANIYWREGSMDIDPQWVGENDDGTQPYMLSEFSPAIGAGTLDIPGFEFPEYDLAGNPRIVDGRIDMGAYQWYPLGGKERVRRGDAERERNTQDEFNLRNFPNPAVTLVNHSTVGVEGHRSSTTGTNIAFELPENGKVMIEIYNLKGQFVKRIFDAYIPQGEYNVFWDGKDERGSYVATGFYMYNLHFNEQLVATGRATFVK